MVSDCIFCKIIDGDIPATKIYEDQNILAFNDAFPAAEHHLLVVPKKHIRSLNDLTEDDANIIANITLAIPKIAKMSDLEKGFKTLVNTEKAGGQSVFHLHYHILGGTFNKTHGLFHT